NPAGSAARRACSPADGIESASRRFVSTAANNASNKPLPLLKLATFHFGQLSAAYAFALNCPGWVFRTLSLVLKPIFPSLLRLRRIFGVVGVERLKRLVEQVAIPDDAATDVLRRRHPAIIDHLVEL